MNSNEDLNRINEKLLLEVNSTGKMYITHTKLDGRYTLRLATSQTHVETNHAREAWKLILGKAGMLKNSINR
jgi:aromatic-L-amino-acid decarboxylase